MAAAQTPAATPAPPLSQPKTLTKGCDTVGLSLASGSCGGAIVNRWWTGLYGVRLAII
ncbi:hypothetical protein DY78_GL001498 [Lactiplantibacillus fabifermentans DSM 21115]|uniref:Uncharacterized protein n=1 Tax=Lactiplantibacillus fabifermentans DSM 21115 TaxID=1413187 RepID=A0A0R2NTU8_9LACO|nr:hypothetical protein DY78_GL001498 [Lactiplantibacillus fabifermentans DSM 21115]